MSLEKLIGPAADAIPDPLKPFVQALIEGRCMQIFVVAEFDGGDIADVMPIIDVENANRFAMVGAIEVAKRDYMRCHVRSRINYEEREDDE